MRAIEYRQIIGDRVHYWGYIDNCFVGPITNQQRKPIHCQFTGLYDRNGVKIFEGDIVRWQVNEVQTVGEIYYADGWFDMRTPKWGSIGWDALRGQSEVIGNIRQNPELLESAS
jgi:hypothetical protein